jgi:lysophospholipase L1-like esterase
MIAGELKHRDITAAYDSWLTAARNACPKAHIFGITPPLGWHSADITAAFKRHRKAGDRRIHLISTAPLQSKFGIAGPTELAPDGVHPSVYGNAMLAALIVSEVSRRVRVTRTARRPRTEIRRASQERGGT